MLPISWVKLGVMKKHSKEFSKLNKNYDDELIIAWSIMKEFEKKILENFKLSQENYKNNFKSGITK